MKPSMEPPHSDVAPLGYPQDQQQHLQPSPLQSYGQQSLGQPPYGQQQYPQQPYYQQPYAQPPYRPQQPYAYPPMAASHLTSGGVPSPYGVHVTPYAAANAGRYNNSSQQAYHTASPYDEEAGRFNQAMSFAEKAVRLAFVRKVFGILSLMMALTVGVVCVFMFVNPVKDYLHAPHTWPFWTSFALSFGILIYLSCSSSGVRKYPLNVILLFVFTLCQSVLIGTITIYADPKAVLIAAVCTLGITLALTLFATQSKFDLTTSGGVLIGALLVLIICSLIGIFIRVRWYHVVIAGVGALLFCVFLVYDIQLIMGQGKYSLGPDDYVFGALALYLDIINIFLYILTIIGLVQDD